jgi:hypothetical protein
MMLMQQQQQQQHEMMAAQQQQQQHGMFGHQAQPDSMAGAAVAVGPSGRLFQQAASGAGLGAPTAGAPPAGGMTLEEDDMDL